MIAEPIQYIILRSSGPVSGFETAVIQKLLTASGATCVALVEQDGSAPKSGAIAWFHRFFPEPGADRPAMDGLPRLSLDEAARLPVAFVLDLSTGPGLHEPPFRATHGVWRLVWSQAGRDTNAPIAALELAAGANHIQITLEQRDIPPMVLEEAIVSTNPASYTDTWRMVCVAAAGLPTRAVSRLLQSGRLLKNSRHGVPSSDFTWVELARFMIRFLAAAIRQQVHGILFTEMWGVAVINQPISDLVQSEPRVTSADWLPAPGAMRFWADPFLVKDGQQVALWMEEFDYRKSQGYIVAMPVESTTGPAEVMIDEGVHMSYPFPIHYQNSLYCIPESQRSRQAAIYRREESGAWKKVKTMLHDFAALDSTVVFHEGKWWLFCTCQDDLPECNLYIWYAADLFGPWEAHPLNPVKTDVRSSRPGGTPFIREGKLYRPAQDSSDGYGSALAINCVLRLTTSEFEEEVVARIRPIKPYDDGLHTLSGMDGLTVLDGKKMTFIPELSWRRIRHKARMLWRTISR